MVSSTSDPVPGPRDLKSVVVDSVPALDFHTDSEALFCSFLVSSSICLLSLSEYSDRCRFSRTTSSQAVQHAVQPESASSGSIPAELDVLASKMWMASPSMARSRLGRRHPSRYASS